VPVDLGHTTRCQHVTWPSHASFLGQLTGDHASMPLHATGYPPAGCPLGPRRSGAQRLRGCASAALGNNVGPHRCLWAVGHDSGLIGAYCGSM